MPEGRLAVRRAAPRVAIALTALWAIAGCGSDDPPSTTAPAPTTLTPTVVSTAPPTTAARVPDSAPPASSTQPPNTFPPSSSTPEVSVPVTLTGATLEIASPLMTNPFLLERVAELDDLVVYDGETVDGDFVLRCVAVGRHEGVAWSEWCALPGDSGTFAVVDGIDPIVVDVGPEHGDISIERLPSTWAVTTAGCSDPLVTLIETAALAPAAATGIACAGDVAFLTYSSVFMQPGPIDGGGSLLVGGEEGWNEETEGTAVGCGDLPEYAAVCEQLGVESEMLEAVTPIPSSALIAPQRDFVDVRDVTSDVTAMIGDGDSRSDDADVDTVSEAIVEALTSTAGGVAPSVTRHDQVSFKRYSLLVVDMPADDGAARSTTYAVWITTPTADIPATVYKAYAWTNCAAGVADATSCA